MILSIGAWHQGRLQTITIVGILSLALTTNSIRASLLCSFSPISSISPTAFLMVNKMKRNSKEVKSDSKVSATDKSGSNRITRCATVCEHSLST